MNSPGSDEQLIAMAYDAGAEDEAMRLSSSPMGEFEKHLVSKTVMANVPPESVIVDIGSGPGIHAEYFLSQGHYMGCVDLSLSSLKLFCKRIARPLMSRVLFHEVSCATQLDWIDDGIADAILLMGPMYHLTRESCRIKVLEHCRRILKENGLLLVMFMSPYPIVDPQLRKQARVIDIQQNGDQYVSYTDFKGFSVPQYRCWPNEAEKLVRRFFSVEAAMNVSPMADCCKGTGTLAEDWPGRQTELFTSLEQICTDEQKIRVAHQYLMVLKKTVLPV